MGSYSALTPNMVESPATLVLLGLLFGIDVTTCSPRHSFDVAFVVAIGGKADTIFCSAYVRL